MGAKAAAYFDAGGSSPMDCLCDILSTSSGEKHAALAVCDSKGFLENESAAMHELAIAQNILELVQQSVPKEQAGAVRWIRIRVGQLSGVVPDSLDFCFNAIVSETEMPKASLAIEHMPTVSRCKNCMYQFQIEDLVFLCPACRSANLELISGKDLEVVEIELADENDEAL
jgi:hydrogenase nickel incorporation protein HypA/HybF